MADPIQKYLKYMMAGIIFIAVLPSLFDLSLLTGLGFIGAVVFSILNGTMSEDPNKMIIMIIAGTILTFIASTLMPSIRENFLSRNFFGLIVLIILFLGIWLKGRGYKQGKNIKL